MSSYSLVGCCQHFGGTYCFHLQGRRGLYPEYETNYCKPCLATYKATWCHNVSSHFAQKCQEELCVMGGLLVSQRVSVLYSSPLTA